MMKKLLSAGLTFLSLITYAQDNVGLKYPIYPGCENYYSNKENEECFNYQVSNFIYNNFQVPDHLKNSDSNEEVIVVFEVNQKGKFKILSINNSHPDLVKETHRVFETLPEVTPANYAGVATYQKYSYRITIPLEQPKPIGFKEEKKVVFEKSTEKTLTELDSIQYKTFENPQFKSKLNIPFSHSYYAQFDRAMNQMGSNNHTASKPYVYSEVNKYIDLEAENQKLYKNKSSWFGRKLWNENFVAIQGDNYWFTMNPILDLRLGKDSNSDSKYTYNNTRALQIQGEIGKEISFTTTIYESQGRFADYYNALSNSMKPSGGNPAIIPGIGIAKDFKTDGYDFPSADANIAYTPNEHFNLNLGYGRNFIGDGYRSLLQGDGASPYPYLKINTTFWKIKYTNTYMWLKDVRNEVTQDRTYATKYMANHYLSWNVNNRLNIGFFESVVWSNTNDRGFDVNFVNPIIFYRSVEFTSSSRAGNALLGLTSKYKINNKVNLYGQFLLDEFSLGDVKKGESSWKNKFGYQIGGKYYDAFNIDGLLLQAEANFVRPYVYSHSNPLTNYAHNNQSMGHQWGGNFKELILIARYHKNRWFADGKITIGERGLDFNSDTNNYNYGSNIYLSYNDDRPNDTGVKIGQGNKANILIGDIQAGYLINPATNLKLFANVTYRNFDPMADNLPHFKQNTVWFQVGVRADLFNWYFDY